MKPILLMGADGRMNQVLKNLFLARDLAFDFLERDQSDQVWRSKLSDCIGLIDFSAPDVTVRCSSLIGKTPWVCGTTGLQSQHTDALKSASLTSAVVVDSNFSIGIEYVCQFAEKLAANQSEFSIHETHHKHKKDAPSGTALKIAERIKSVQPEAKIQISSARQGEVVGDHRLTIAFGQESIAIEHRAFDREVFAEGALHALMWAQKQKPGLYAMRNIL